MSLTPAREIIHSRYHPRVDFFILPEEGSATQWRETRKRVLFGQKRRLGACLRFVHHDRFWGILTQTKGALVALF